MFIFIFYKMSSFDEKILNAVCNISGTTTTTTTTTTSNPFKGKNPIDPSDEEAAPASPTKSVETRTAPPEKLPTEEEEKKDETEEEEKKDDTVPKADDDF